jgi:hypothetical protein
MSVLVAVYASLSLYCFFDLPSSKLMKMSQSYFASFKLSAFCLGYLFDALSSNQSIEFYFIVMTLIITADSYLSYNYLMKKHQFEEVSEEEEASFLHGNWKHGLFYSQTAKPSTKTFGAFILTLQSLFSFSGIFNFNGLSVTH